MFAYQNILYLCSDLFSHNELLQSNISGNNDPYERRKNHLCGDSFVAEYFRHRGLFVFSPEPDYIEAKTKKKLDRRSLEITKIPGNVRNLTTRLSRLMISKVPLQIKDAKFQSLLKYRSKRFA